MTDTSNSSSGPASGGNQSASDQTFLEAMRLVTPTERIGWKGFFVRRMAAVSWSREGLLGMRSGKRWAHRLVNRLKRPS